MTQDMTSLKKELTELRDGKESLFADQKELSQKIGGLISKLKEHKEHRDKLTTQVREGKEKRNQINKEIRKLIEDVKKLQGTSVQSSASSTMPKDVTPGKLKREIEGIQKTIETAAVSFDKEKELMKQLKEKKKLLDKFGTQSENRGAIKEVDKQLKILKKESDDVHDVVQAAAKQSQEEHESMLKLSKEIDGLRESEKAIREKITPLKEKIRAQSKELDGQIKERGGDPTRRYSKQKSTRVQQKSKADQEAQLAVVQTKLSGKKKLTTDDLLVLQNAKDDDFNFDAEKEIDFDFDAEKDLDETIDLSDADMDEAQESMMDESDIEDLKSDKKAE